MIDVLFIIATAAFGFGLSLVTYRPVASRWGWPMGEWQAHKPVLPLLIGLASMALAFFYAAFLGSQWGGWMILVMGLVLALFWTGFLRVASQTSLILAPIASLLLMFGWASGLYTVQDWRLNAVGAVRQDFERVERNGLKALDPRRHETGTEPSKQ